MVVRSYQRTIEAPTLSRLRWCCEGRRPADLDDDDDALRHSLANLDSLRRLPHPGFRLRGRVPRSDHARETDSLILDVRMPGMGEQPQARVRPR